MEPATTRLRSSMVGMHGRAHMFRVCTWALPSSTTVTVCCNRQLLPRWNTCVCMRLWCPPAGNRDVAWASSQSDNPFVQLNFGRSFNDVTAVVIWWASGACLPCKASTPGRLRCMYACSEGGHWVVTQPSLPCHAQADVDACKAPAPPLLAHTTT